ncbi:hypothetical protein EPO05_02710 [Patescibacteria group bacterium]|nr:MAG: hypothetical protein EPO05_02710 [Patescibacteria group bacterium]
MIKKNTKVIFEDGGEQKTSEMLGGMPLSKGEVVHVHAENSAEVIDYEVADKIIDCYLQGEDQTVNITYVLRKK